MIAAEQAKAILGWWRTNLSLTAPGNPGAARALAARLRRAVSPVEALSEPAVFSLGKALGLTQEGDALNLAMLATTLAHVKEHLPTRLARRMGGEERPALSQLRFQRILRAEAGSELADFVRRALPMVEHSCNVGQLGVDLLHWDEKTRTRWCFDYFHSIAPHTDEPSEPATEDEPA